MCFLVLLLSLYTSTFVQECGPTVAPETTQAIIQVESGGNPYAIGDNTDRKSFFPKTADEAVAVASQLLSLGHNIDLGLMQINSSHLSSLKIPLKDFFDPCENVRIGTTILSEFYRKFKTDDTTQSLFMALSAYNTGQAWKGAVYINQILKAAGANYRVILPSGIPETKKAGIRTPVETKETARGLAASSPLFFENHSSAMSPSGF